MWDWIKEKWKLCLGALAAFVGGILFLLQVRSRERGHARVLENANESHKKELKANKESQEALEAGEEKIASELKEKKDQIEKDADEKSAEVEEEKKAFVKAQKKSDRLARDLADALGADFVDSSD